MGKTLDLFGDPVPPNRGRRGRPQHVATKQNRNKVTMLLALGWANERIAQALSITAPTLTKHYFSILDARTLQRDRMDAAIAMKLWEGVQEGNVSATREFIAFVERNDLMIYGQTSPPAKADAPAAKLGKKEAALAAAQNPDRGTPLGQLIARRQTSH
jgi:hypothetical protein